MHLKFKENYIILERDFIAGKTAYFVCRNVNKLIYKFHKREWENRIFNQVIKIIGL